MSTFFKGIERNATQEAKSQDRAAESEIAESQESNNEGKNAEYGSPETPDQCNIKSDAADSVVDDTGNEVTDGETLPPNTTFMLNGVEYKTDDNGKVYSVDGKPVPNQTYYLDGHEYRTDDNGRIYCKDGVYYSNHSFRIDDKQYRTDDNGNIYLIDGKPIPNSSYCLFGHTFETDSGGNLVSFDGKQIKDLTFEQFNVLQKTQIREGRSRLEQGETLSKAELGNLGEMMMDQYYIAKGYTPLNRHRVSSLQDKKDGFKTGIDGVYEKDGQYIIVDAKYNTSQLSDTLDGKQMSDTWIDARLDECVGKEKADQIREAEIEGKVQHKVFHIDKVDSNGSTACDTYFVDGDGNKSSQSEEVCQFDSTGDVILNSTSDFVRQKESD